MAAAVQRIGVSGSVLLLLAAFMPVWGGAQGGTAADVSLFEAMRFLPLLRDELGAIGGDVDDAIVGSTAAFACLVLVAAVGYAMALLGARRLLLIPALLAAVVVGGLFAYSLAEIGRINDDIGGGLGGEVHLAWGWAIHLLAVSALLAAAVMGFFVRPAAACRPVARVATAVSAEASDDTGREPAPRRGATGAAEDWHSASGPGGWMLSGKTPQGRRVRLRLEDADLERGVVLGRGPTRADILIDHESVSRAHVRVGAGRGGLRFEDLGSTNGTRIDGRMLAPGEPTEASSGAEVRVGDVRFVLSHR